MLLKLCSKLADIAIMINKSLRPIRIFDLFFHDGGRLYDVIATSLRRFILKYSLQYNGIQINYFLEQLSILYVFKNI